MDREEGLGNGLRIICEVYLRGIKSIVSCVRISTVRAMICIAEMCASHSELLSRLYYLLLERMVYERTKKNKISF